jgi:hypothetical protein
MLSDSEMDQLCDVLIKHEGIVPWLYCDDRGFVTVGVGDKLTSNTAATMPFVDSAGAGVDGEAKRIAYARVQDAYRQGLTADAYRACSDLRLPIDFCKRRLALRLKGEFLPAIACRCPDAANFPLAAKLVLVDIAYNVGVAGFNAFHSLIEACNALHFDKAADHVHTRKAGEDPQNSATWGKRNMWRYKMMLLAHSVAVTIGE